MLCYSIIAYFLLLLLLMLQLFNLLRQLPLSFVFIMKFQGFTTAGVLQMPCNILQSCCDSIALFHFDNSLLLQTDAGNRHQHPSCAILKCLSVIQQLKVYNTHTHTNTAHSQRKRSMYVLSYHPPNKQQLEKISLPPATNLWETMCEQNLSRLSDNLITAENSTPAK